MPLVVTAADITAAIIRIDAAAKGVDAVFANCASLDAGTRGAWTAWLAGWDQFASDNKDLAYLTLGLPDIGDLTAGYEADVGQWQIVANTKCASQIPILVSQIDVANANAALAPLPSSWSKAIPWIAGAAALIFVVPPVVNFARELATKRGGRAPLKNPAQTREGFASWGEFLAWAQPGAFVLYKAPMDYRARTVRIVRVFRNGKVRIDPMSNDADNFTADAGHLDRFQRRG